MPIRDSGPPLSALTTLAPLPYHRMRLAWCRLALLDFLRRWGVYLLVLAAVVGGGTVGALSSLSALTAWLVLPLFQAAAQPMWLLPAVLLQALAGALLVWGTRTLLWPPRWAEIERALPLGRRETGRSDLIVVSLALLPLTLLYAVGAATWWLHNPAWLRPVRVRAVLMLLLAVAGSLALGVALLQALRRPDMVPGPVRRLLGRMWRRNRSARISQAHLPPAAAQSLSDPAPSATDVAHLKPATWWHALIWWPLWRGPAQRAGHALLLGTTALWAMAAGLWRWPAQASWWLAGFAALGLLVSSRLHRLAREGLVELHQACAMLPISPHAPAWALSLLALAPLTLGLTALLAVLHGGAAPVAGQIRPAVLAAYVATSLLASLIDVRPGQTHMAAEQTSSRWLFSLVLLLALASEVMA
ncbi:MAG: hypothetical protein AB3X44_19645 [Leptothrix sp. (in: b-proteobacteria)]